MDTEKLFNNEKEDKLIVSFNKLLKQFVKELDKTYPEYNILKIKEYKNIDDKDEKYLLYYMNFIEKDIKKIANEDETLFEQEDTYFLRDIEFSRIWNNNISDSTKQAIWKFLQTLYLIGKPFMNNKTDIHQLITDYNDIISNDTEKDPKKLKLIKKELDIISKIIRNINQEKEHQKEQRKEQFKQGGNGQLPEFLENSKIGQLAQELSSELDLDELGFGNLDEGNADPQNIFNNVLGKNPQKLMGLIQNVGTKIQSKLSEGDINENDLVGEAQNMMSSLGGNGMFQEMFNNPNMKNIFQNMGSMFGNNPEMKQMFDNIDPQEFQNFAKNFGQNMGNGQMPGMPGNNNNQNVRVDQNKVKKMETKARLKKKLEDRKKKESEQLNNNSSQPIILEDNSTTSKIEDITDPVPIEKSSDTITDKKHKKKIAKKPTEQQIEEIKNDQQSVTLD